MVLTKVGGAVSALWHLTAWRRGRGVYRFDPDLAAALADTGSGRALPVEVLHRLPERCPYVLLPEAVDSEDGVTLFGFFVAVAWDAEEEVAELRVLVDGGRGDEPAVPSMLTSSVYRLRSGFSIEEANAEGIDAAVAAHPDAMDAEVIAAIHTSQQALAQLVLPLILYLCSDQADIAAPPAPPGEGTSSRGERRRACPAGRGRMADRGSAANPAPGDATAPG